MGGLPRNFSSSADTQVLVPLRKALSRVRPDHSFCREMRQEVGVQALISTVRELSGGVPFNLAGGRRRRGFMRSFSKFAAIALATLTLGAATVHAQTAAQPAQPNCGVETWSTDKMMYVTTPCPGGTAASGQTAAAPGSSNCGVETWSTDKMMYVTTPCAHGTTYENPSAKPTENPNTK